MGIGIIAISFINEKRKYLLKRLWTLANEYFGSQNWGNSALRKRGIVSDESMLDFLERNGHEIQQKKPDLYVIITGTLDEYKSHPKLVSPLLYVSFVCVVAGMIFSSMGLTCASEWGSTGSGTIFAGIIIFIFIVAIISYLLLILRSILPVIKSKTKSKS